VAPFGANREDVPPAPARVFWINGGWDWQGTGGGQGAGIAGCAQAISGTAPIVGHDGKRAFVRGGGDGRWVKDNTWRSAGNPGGPPLKNA
jgi:hypothetical protein